MTMLLGASMARVIGIEGARVAKVHERVQRELDAVSERLRDGRPHLQTDADRERVVEGLSRAKARAPRR